MTARAITHRAAVDLRDIDRVPALIGRLAPADILLFWRIGRPNVVVWYQKTCGYPELGVRMGHVALYLGDGDLVHASPASLTTACASRLQGTSLRDAR